VCLPGGRGRACLKRKKREALRTSPQRKKLAKQEKILS
jgi:hypothetical protein